MAYSEQFTSVRIKNSHQDPVLNVKKKIVIFFITLLYKESQCIFVAEVENENSK